MIKAALRKSHKKYGLNKRPYLQTVAVCRGRDRSDKWMGKLLSGENLWAYNKDVRPKHNQEQQHPERSKEKHKVSSIISERNHFGAHLNQLFHQRDAWDSSTETTSECRHRHRRVCLCGKIV